MERTKVTPDKGRTAKVSISAIKTFKQCRRRYFLEYVEGLTPVKKAAALSFGSCVHAGLEWMFKSDREGHPGLEDTLYKLYTAEEISEAGDLEVRVAIETLDAFAEKVNYAQWEFKSIEPAFECSMGYAKKMIGRFDGIVSVAEYGDKLFLLENKTAATIDQAYLNHLLWDDQAGFYIAAARKMDLDVCGILYNIIPKTKIKPLKATPLENRKYKQDGALYAKQREQDESNDEYVERVRLWYKEADFVQHIVYRTDSQLDALERQFDMLIRDMKTCEKEGTFYPNGRSCEILRCPYESICLEDTPEAREANFKRREV